MKEVQKKGSLHLCKIRICAYIALKSHKLSETSNLIMITIQLIDVLGC